MPRVRRRRHTGIPRWEQLACRDYSRPHVYKSPIAVDPPHPRCFLVPSPAQPCLAFRFVSPPPLPELFSLSLPPTFSLSHLLRRAFILVRAYHQAHYISTDLNLTVARRPGIVRTIVAAPLALVPLSLSLSSFVSSLQPTVVRTYLSRRPPNTPIDQIIAHDHIIYSTWLQVVFDAPANCNCFIRRTYPCESLSCGRERERERASAGYRERRRSLVLSFSSRSCY